jgi:hypothetical protein
LKSLRFLLGGQSLLVVDDPPAIVQLVGDFREAAIQQVQDDAQG